MSRESSYNAIILKKQSYGEGDEILTVFSREAGKLRVLAKSIKFSKSKLQYSLQTLFLVRLTLAGSSNFPKVIGAEVLESFGHIRQNLSGAKIAFYVLELLMKFTADEQKNEPLFDLGVDFFKFLDKPGNLEQDLLLGLAKFKIEFLETLGLGVSAPENGELNEGAGFSNLRGGFLFADNAADYQKTGKEVFRQFLTLRRLGFSQLPQARQELGDLNALQNLLSGFIRYQLERDIKSEDFLGIADMV